MRRNTGLILLLGMMVCALISQACSNLSPHSNNPASFSTGNFTLGPARVRPGEDTTLGLWVTNTGGLTGTYTIEVKVDGSVFKTENVTLAGGKKQKVSFSIVVPLVGIHQVVVDNFTGTFSVGVGEDY